MTIHRMCVRGKEKRRHSVLARMATDPVCVRGKEKRSLGACWDDKPSDVCTWSKK